MFESALYRISKKFRREAHKYFREVREEIENIAALFKKEHDRRSSELAEVEGLKESIEELHKKQQEFFAKSPKNIKYNEMRRKEPLVGMANPYFWRWFVFGKKTMEAYDKVFGTLGSQEGIIKLLLNQRSFGEREVAEIHETLEKIKEAEAQLDATNSLDQFYWKVRRLENHIDHILFMGKHYMNLHSIELKKEGCLKAFDQLCRELEKELTPKRLRDNGFTTEDLATITSGIRELKKLVEAILADERAIDFFSNQTLIDFSELKKRWDLLTVHINLPKHGELNWANP